MHFVTSCDANYLKYIKVLMASVYANHPNNEELTFHVLYRDLPEDEIKKVCAFAESHHQIAHFIEFDEEKYAPVMKKFSHCAGRYRTCTHFLLMICCRQMWTEFYRWI